MFKRFKFSNFPWRAYGHWTNMLGNGGVLILSCGQGSNEAAN